MADQPDCSNSERDIEQRRNRQSIRIGSADANRIASLRESAFCRRNAENSQIDGTEAGFIENDRADDLRPAVGIVVGVPLAVLLWLALIWIARSL